SCCATSTTCLMRRSPTSWASPRRRPRCACTGPVGSCGSGCSRCAARRRPVPSDLINCDEVASALPQIVDGSGHADRAVLTHVESCLRCQAELVQYRKLLRALHNLRTEVLEPAPGTLSGILANLEAAGERGAIRSLLT